MHPDIWRNTLKYYKIERRKKQFESHTSHNSLSNKFPKFPGQALMKKISIKSFRNIISQCLSIKLRLSFSPPQPRPSIFMPAMPPIKISIDALKAKFNPKLSFEAYSPPLSRIVVLVTFISHTNYHLLCSFSKKSNFCLFWNILIKKEKFCIHAIYHLKLFWLNENKIWNHIIVKKSIENSICGVNLSCFKNVKPDCLSDPKLKCP